MERKGFDPRTLATIAVMTALVLLLTSIIRVPTPAKGYAHLGDTGVFFSAFAFGPWIGAVAGGLGTGLSDLMSPYMQFAPASLLIHGLEGLVAGLLVRRIRGLGGFILAAVVGGIIVVTGYFLVEIPMYGVPAAAGEVPANILQVIIGALVAVPLFTAVRQAYPPITRFASQSDRSAILVVSLLVCLLGIVAGGVMLARLLYWHVFVASFDLPLAVAAGLLLVSGLFGILLQARRR